MPQLLLFLNLGLAGWSKVVGGSWDVPGCPGLSHGNLGQLGPGTGRVVLGSGDVPGCPGLSHGNLGHLGPGTGRVV